MNDSESSTDLETGLVSFPYDGKKNGFSSSKSMSKVYNRLSEGQVIPGEGGRDSTAESRITYALKGP